MVRSTCFLRPAPLSRRLLVSGRHARSTSHTTSSSRSARLPLHPTSSTGSGYAARLATCAQPIPTSASTYTKAPITTYVPVYNCAHRSAITSCTTGFRPRASIRHLPANKGVFSPARSPSYGHGAGPPGSGAHQVWGYKSGRVPRPACDCRDRERVAPTAHAELGDVCSMRQGRGGLCWERERKERLAGR